MNDAGNYEDGRDRRSSCRETGVASGASRASSLGVE
jgi:hypothetical protein